MWRVAFRIVSSLMHQLLMSPFIKPEMMIKTNTVTFIAVKTVFTITDSYTPCARTPEIKKKKDIVTTFQLAAYSILSNKITNDILPASCIISPAAKQSGYGAKPGEVIGVCFPRVSAMRLCIRSSKVPVQAFATLDVPGNKSDIYRPMTVNMNTLPNTALMRVWPLGGSATSCGSKQHPQSFTTCQYPTSSSCLIRSHVGQSHSQTLL